MGDAAGRKAQTIAPFRKNPPVPTTTSILGQLLSLPTAPLMDLRSGCITEQWLGLPRTLLARTGGAAPIPAMLRAAGTIAEAAQTAVATAPPDGPIHALLPADNAHASQAIAAAAANDGGSPLLALLLADADGPRVACARAIAPARFAGEPGHSRRRRVRHRHIGCYADPETAHTVYRRIATLLRDPIGYSTRPDAERYCNDPHTWRNYPQRERNSRWPTTKKFLPLRTEFNISSLGMSWLRGFGEKAPERLRRSGAFSFPESPANVQ